MNIAHTVGFIVYNDDFSIFLKGEVNRALHYDFIIRIGIIVRNKRRVYFYGETLLSVELRRSDYAIKQTVMYELFKTMAVN